jgi:hypothetical protein
VTVILHGDNLQLLEKAALVVSGRKVNGTQATLQDGGSSTERSVSISAGSKAKVGTQAVLQVSAGKGRQGTSIDVANVSVVAAQTTSTWYRDMDGDLFGDSNVTREAATQPADFVATGGDCDDTNPDFRPGAEELADGVDNDCDGQVDEGLATTWYRDMDGDLFGDSNVTRQEAMQPADFVATGGDCDDTNPDFHPGAQELADGVDNDCDGQVDEGLATTWYRDMDGDLFGDSNVTREAATQPADFVATGGDCDDTNPDFHPGAEDSPGDGVDNDCDGKD